MNARLLLSVLLLIAICRPSFAAPPAESGEDFHQARQAWWQVLDQTGLNVRGGANLAALLTRPRATWRKIDPNTWPSRGKLPLFAVIRTHEVQGSSVLLDVRGKPWIIVDVGGGHVGVVRANSRYVTPAPQEPLRAKADGNYGMRTTHLYWEVVDADPAGLNMRLHPRYPAQYDSVDAVFPPGPVRNWPQVGHVTRGTVLKACLGNNGLIFQRDADGATWLLVERPGGGLGMVRWNSRFVRPTLGPLLPP